MTRQHAVANVVATVDGLSLTVGGTTHELLVSNRPGPNHVIVGRFLIDYSLSGEPAVLTLFRAASEQQSMAAQPALDVASLNVPGIDPPRLAALIGPVPAHCTDFQHVFEERQLIALRRIERTLYEASGLALTHDDNENRVAQRLKHVQDHRRVCGAALTLLSGSATGEDPEPSGVEPLRQLLQRAEQVESLALNQVQVDMLRLQRTLSTQTAELTKLSVEAAERQREEDEMRRRDEDRRHDAAHRLTLLGTCIAVPVLIVNTLAAAPPPHRDWNILFVLISALTATTLAYRFVQHAEPTSGREGGVDDLAETAGLAKRLLADTGWAEVLLALVSLLFSSLLYILPATSH